MKAIETRYKGYRFRSRLEARWAVFFDALGVSWTYESQGYDLNGRLYLPDFDVPILGFVEVKPLHDRDSVLDRDRETWTELAKQSQRDVFVLFGQPGDGHVPRTGDATGGGVWFDSYGERVFWFAECRGCGGLSLGATDVWTAAACTDWCKSERGPIVADHIRHAVAAARGARFEHGETPVPIPLERERPTPITPELEAALARMADINKRIVASGCTSELLDEKVTALGEIQRLSKHVFNWRRP